MPRVDRTEFTNFCSHTPRFDPKCESSGHGRNITNTVTAIIILIAIKTAVDVADVADVAVTVVVAVNVAAVFVITFILTVAVAVADVYVVAKIGMQACVVFCSVEITIL